MTCQKKRGQSNCDKQDQRDDSGGSPKPAIKGVDSRLAQKQGLAIQLFHGLAKRLNLRQSFRCCSGDLLAGTRGR